MVQNGCAVLAGGYKVFGFILPGKNLPLRKKGRALPCGNPKNHFIAGLIPTPVKPFLQAALLPSESDTKSFIDNTKQAIFTCL